MAVTNSERIRDVPSFSGNEAENRVVSALKKVSVDLGQGAWRPPSGFSPRAISCGGNSTGGTVAQIKLKCAWDDDHDTVDLAAGVLHPISVVEIDGPESDARRVFVWG